MPNQRAINASTRVLPVHIKYNLYGLQIGLYLTVCSSAFVPVLDYNQLVVGVDREVTIFDSAPEILRPLDHL